VCRSCAVLVDGEPARACLLLALQADGADVMSKHPALTRQEGPEAVSRNLCRCIGYSGIVQAIVAAVEL
jgi:aerobic-type carbon monoxide dehydrogenase small subunit (CoxS/CutS family)